MREVGSPTVLVTHSLSCSLVVYWARRSSSERVAVVVLVSLADADSHAHTPSEARAFSPVLLDPLPFRAVVVVSSTDPYVEIEQARFFARAAGGRVSLRWGIRDT